MSSLTESSSTVNSALLNKTGEAMASMESMHAAMSSGKMPLPAKTLAATAVATAGASTGKSAVIKFIRHPLTAFLAGAAVGFAIYHYRKQIIASVSRDKADD